MGQQPRLLDLCCSAGGCSVGYERAGFDVTGVDHRPQKRYPCRFVLDDALNYLARRGRDYDLIAASPPCQPHSVARTIPGRDMAGHIDILAPLRELLLDLGKPYIIENVPGAPLRDPVLLCGAMFPGIRVYRHRLFESSLPLVAPPHPKHAERILVGSRERRLAVWYGQTSLTGLAGDMLTAAGKGFSKEAGAAAMKIDWMSQPELAQAIPPAYTEYLGRQALSFLGAM